MIDLMAVAPALAGVEKCMAGIEVKLVEHVYNTGNGWRYYQAAGGAEAGALCRAE